MNTEEALSSLRDAIQRLSLNADRQISYLDELNVGNCADELALEFDDIVGVVPTLTESGAIAPHLCDKILNLERQLSSMSGVNNSVLWTKDALRNSAEWKEVRQMARQIIDYWTIDA